MKAERQSVVKRHRLLRIGWQAVLAMIMVPSVTSAGEPLVPQPIYREESPGGFETHTTLPAKDSVANPSPAFFAIAGREWPAGYPPVFSVERKGVSELVRLPPRGRENFTEPLFFALPSAGETGRLEIAGSWRVTAEHRDGHTDWFRWELTALGERVAGRFDPETDYRFAFITGGTWRTNMLRLDVDYINEHFELVGCLGEGGLSGTWRRTDGNDGGDWTATRGEPVPAIDWKEWIRVPLFEWSRPEDGRRVWRIETEPMPPPWKRIEPPLCDVWVRP